MVSRKSITLSLHNWTITTVKMPTGNAANIMHPNQLYHSKVSTLFDYRAIPNSTRTHAGEVPSGGPSPYALTPSHLC